MREHAQNPNVQKQGLTVICRLATNRKRAFANFHATPCGRATGSGSDSSPSVGLCAHANRCGAHALEDSPLGGRAGGPARVCTPGRVSCHASSSFRRRCATVRQPSFVSFGVKSCVPLLVALHALCKTAFAALCPCSSLVLRHSLTLMTALSHSPARISIHLKSCSACSQLAGEPARVHRGAGEHGGSSSQF